MLAGTIVFLTIALALTVGIVVGWVVLAAVLRGIDWGNRPLHVRSASASQKLPAAEPQPVG